MQIKDKVVSIETIQLANTAGKRVSRPLFLAACIKFESRSTWKTVFIISFQEFITACLDSIFLLVFFLPGVFRNMLPTILLTVDLKLIITAKFTCVTVLNETKTFFTDLIK